MLVTSLSIIKCTRCHNLDSKAWVLLRSPLSLPTPPLWLEKPKISGRRSRRGKKSQSKLLSPSWLECFVAGVEVFSRVWPPQNFVGSCWLVRQGQSASCVPSAQDPVVSEAKVIDQRLSGEHGPFTALGARSPVQRPGSGSSGEAQRSKWLA